MQCMHKKVLFKIDNKTSKPSRWRWQNRSGRLSNRLANVHCMAAEKPADEILEVLNSNNFKHFVLIIGFFIASS